MTETVYFQGEEVIIDGFTVEQFKEMQQKEPHRLSQIKTNSGVNLFVALNRFEIKDKN